MAKLLYKEFNEHKKRVLTNINLSLFEIHKDLKDLELNIKKENYSISQHYSEGIKTLSNNITNYLIELESLEVKK